MVISLSLVWEIEYIGLDNCSFILYNKFNQGDYIIFLSLARFIQVLWPEAYTT